MLDEFDFYTHLLDEQSTDEFKNDVEQTTLRNIDEKRRKARETAKIYRQKHPDHVAMRGRVYKYRQALFKRANGVCHWCHKKLIKYEIDHILPLSLGGTNALSNLCVACPKCNKHRKRTTN